MEGLQEVAFRFETADPVVKIAVYRVAVPCFMATVIVDPSPYSLHSTMNKRVLATTTHQIRASL